MKNTPNKFFWIFILFAAMVLLGGIDQTTKDALKVQHILKTIERKPKQPDTNKESIAEVSEKEVNAYIAYRLAREENPIVNNLTVNLLGNNQIQGKVRIKADQLNLGGLLGKDLNFDFKGIVQTRDNAARLNLTDLFLDGYSVQPQVLDFVISSAGALYDTDVGRVGDWYTLPKGMKRVKVQKAKATIYY
ncbi:uncharacterized protein Dvar_65400 [Desulfosarcina variabilis str. Montpellier]|uniref:hypothetical protein n=1 Tax=Desulfosarcina variabilis TaxID=2300 RepID=UPI003AFA4348